MTDMKSKGPMMDRIESHSREKEARSCEPRYATLSENTLGRRRRDFTPKGENRTEFARDRDRILYSKAFFRLSGKTQVFMSPRNPLISNRMTHTIHVAQISRAVARALDLNEDLTEAIALGHDTGHPPFGHRGEKVLDELSREHMGRGFRHNVHGLRMMDILEKGGHGLNLTYEVREGILRHCGESERGSFAPGRPDASLELSAYDEIDDPSTLEGCVVKLCDRIAYVGKDIEDAAASGIISEEDMPENITGILGRTNGEIIDTLIKDLIINFYKDKDALGEKGGQGPLREVLSVRFSQQVLGALNELIREFNYPRIYESEVNNTYSAQTENVVRGLFRHFLAELDAMRVPDSAQASLGDFDVSAGRNRRGLDLSLGELDGPGSEEFKNARAIIISEKLRGFGGGMDSILYFLEQMHDDYFIENGNAQMVIDYITLMTDQMAMGIYKSLTLPEPVV